MKVTTVILNWNGKNDTLACLKSLSKCIPNVTQKLVIGPRQSPGIEIVKEGDSIAEIQSPSLTTQSRELSLQPNDQLLSHVWYSDIIVVDNGSEDGSAEEIKKQFPSVQLIETGKNLGYAGGNNIGIQVALKQGADAVLLLNNDTIADPGMLQAFIESAEKNPSVGIWGGYPLRFSDREHLDHLGGIWNSTEGDFELIGLREKKGFQTEAPLDYVCGCSIFIRRAVFEKIGLLETKFFLFWEEADFAMRAKRAGFGIDICYGALLFHKVSASFIGGSPHKKYFWWRGRLLWIERNCTPEEKKRLFRSLINPELWHYKKLLWIKGAQLKLLKLLRKQNIHEKEEKLKQYRAVAAGLRDYYKGNFDSGPSWLFNKTL